MTLPMPTDQSGVNQQATVTLSANVSGYTQSMAAAQTQTNAVSDSLSKLTSHLDGITKRAGKKLIHFSRDDFAALGGATAMAATFEKQLSTLSATAVVTGAKFSGFKGAVENAFTSFPKSRASIVALVETLTNLGVTAPRDVNTLTQAFVKLGGATGEPMQQLAQGLMQLTRQMGGASSGQVANYANSLLTLSKNAGVSATGVLTFAQAIAPVARTAGIGQASVLGISTAFSKAGADGFLAASAFNTMASDITKLSQTGSPELAKYANLIGVTSNQLRSMDKGQALSRIFTAISQEGPRAIATLNQLGQDGVRAQSAIQAVAQGGGLQQYIDQAVGSSHDQKNLNAGSKAAFSGLADSLGSLRNEFTQFGTEIGTTFLAPMDKAVTIATTLLHALNSLSKPLAPLLGAVGAVGGVVGTALGGGMALAGPIGAAVLGRAALHSGVVRSAREGFQFGRTGVANETSRAAAAGELPLRASAPFGAFSRMGEWGSQGSQWYRTQGAGKWWGPQEGGSGGPSGLGRAALRAPFQTVGWLANAQTESTHNAMLNDYQRADYVKYRQQARSGGAPSGPTLRDRLSGAAAAGRADAGARGAFRALIGESANLGRAFGRLGVETTKAGLQMSMNAVPKVGSTIGKAASGAFGMASSALTNPLFMLAAPLVIGGIATVMKNYNKPSSLSQSDLNPLQHYNDALGIATGKLNTFADIVGKATTAAAGGSPAATSFKQHLTNTDVANFANRGSNDPNINALKPGDVQGATQLARSFGFTDPRQFQGFSQQLLARGYSLQQVNQVVDAYGGPGSTPDVTAMGGLINSAGSAAGRKSVAGAALGSLITQRGTNISKYNATYGQQNYLDQITKLVASSVTSTTPSSQFAELISQLTGKGMGAVKADVAPMVQAGDATQQPGVLRSQFDVLTNPKASQTAKQKAVMAILQHYQGAGGIVGNAGATPGVTLDPSKFGSVEQASRTLSPDQASVYGRMAGPIGQFAATNLYTQAAVVQQDNPQVVQRAVGALVEKAMQLGTSVGGAVTQLEKLKGAAGSTSDPLYKMAAAAEQFIKSQQQAVLPSMSRAQQLQTTSNNYQVAVNNIGLSPTGPADAQAAQQSAQQALESQRQYMISMLQQARAFGVQMTRAQQDYQKSRFRSQRDFQIQMTYSAQDYQLQRFRSYRDFGIQMAREAQSQAQNIYSPWVRVQAKYTDSAATILQNLKDQNTRIIDQYANLRKVAAMGISQQSIDTLQLANPNNAQQLGTLVDSLMQNPQLVNQINSAISTRLQATTQLTQSSFSMQFRNTVADFTKGLNDASVNYQTAHERAVAAQAQSLSDMSIDFNTMVSRSAQDLTVSMTEIYGSFANIYGQTLAAINNNIAAYAPQLANNLTNQLSSAYAALQTYNGALAQAMALNPQFTIGGQGYVSNMNTAQRNALYGGHATGGISTVAHLAHISEGNKPEAIIPLDQRGITYMSGMFQQVAMAMVRTMNVSGKGIVPTGTSTSSSTTVDQSTKFLGPITVQAQDPNQMARQLKDKARLEKLSRPARSTAGISG